jgi:hypothetical protein
MGCVLVDAMKHVVRFLFIMLFFAGLFFVPSGVNTAQTDMQRTSLIEGNPIQNSPAAILPGAVRVALYNETTTTRPSYDDTGLSILLDNYTSIFNILTDAGFDVTRITFQDILDHKLITASYDVLVLADNLPRETVTKHVGDFWLGGGGVLSLDSAAVFLNYMGVIPEAEGTSGYSTYWTYDTHSYSNITERHPTTKSYALGEKLIGESTGLAKFIWSAVGSSTYSDDFIRLAAAPDDDDDVFALGYDSNHRGGRVVHLGIETSTIHENWTALIRDSIKWLEPKPKARIAFDYSHFPYYGVDKGDPCGYSIYSDSSKYTILRDTLVNKSYTFDKFYLSPDGNFTSDRLAPYDILIVNTPEWNFTASEVEAVQSWVEDGGGLWVMGDQTSFFTSHNQNINYLLNEYDMKLNNSQKYDVFHTITSDLPVHPLREEISKLHFSGGVYINITGSAEAIAYNESNIYAAAQEWGEGRIFLTGDINYVADYLDEVDNNQFGVNIANWLSAGSAKVLVYTNEPEGEHYITGKQIQAIQTPVAKALQELDIEYEIYSLPDYFNRSLHSKTWDLVIIDSPWFQFTNAYLNDTEWYVDSGGSLIMSWYRLYLSSNKDHPLWAKLGFEYVEARSIPFTTYIWYTNHPIFNNPIDYGAANFTGPRDYGTVGEIVNVFDNATALAGSWETEAADNATIVLRNDGKTLYNSYLIDQYSGDIDDSTYEDRFELWLNEIVFMLPSVPSILTPPTIDSPSDILKEAGSPGDSITWTPSSNWPSWVTVHAFPLGVYDHLILDEAWDGGQISVPLDVWEHLQPTTITYTITVFDAFGQEATDEVVVTFEDTTDPSLIESPSNLASNESTAEHLLNWTFDEIYPHFYVVYVNGTTKYNGTWDGSELSVDVGGLVKGVWNITTFVNDTSGNSAADTVFLAVTDDINPIFTSEPTNLEYAEGVTSHTLTWEITELHPDSFILYIDGEIEQSGTWSTTELSFNVGGLSEGTYNVTLLVTDISGHSAVSTVTLTVTEEPTTTTETTTTGTLPFGLDTTTLIIIVAAAVGLIIIIIIIMKRRG